MTLTAVILILVAGLAHSGWNLLAKGSKDPLSFLWAALGASVVLFAPFGVWAGATYPPPPVGWGILCVSVTLEVIYVWALGRSYRTGDLSVVYPVARGVSPLLAAPLGVVLLGESVSSQAVFGISVIVLGILTAHLTAFTAASVRGLLGALNRPATRYAVVAGICTGAYSTVDKVGVGFVWPPLYAYLIYVGTAIGLTALLTLGGARPARGVWDGARAGLLPVLAAGFLNPMGYGLILVALALSPVSYVAPAREVSVGIAVFLGAVVLHEPSPLPRLAGAALIALGFYLLATG